MFRVFVYPLSIYLPDYLPYRLIYPIYLIIHPSIYNVIWLMVNGNLAHVASGSFLPPPAPLLDFFWGGLGSLSIRKKKILLGFFFAFAFGILLSRFFSFSLSIWCFSLDWKFAQIEWNWMGIESGSVGGVEWIDWLIGFHAALLQNLKSKPKSTFLSP